jgi:hypothetical protein
VKVELKILAPRFASPTASPPASPHKADASAMSCTRDFCRSLTPSAGMTICYIRPALAF